MDVSLGPNRSVVWLIQSRLSPSQETPSASGSAISVRVRKGGVSGTKKYLLTCQHVVRGTHPEDGAAGWGEVFPEILVWRPGYGFSSPDEHLNRKIGKVPGAFSARVDGLAKTFKHFGKTSLAISERRPSSDWILLSVDNEEFQDYPCVENFGREPNDELCEVLGFPAGGASLKTGDIVSPTKSGGISLAISDQPAELTFEGPGKTTAPGMSGGGVFVGSRLVGVHRSRSDSELKYRAVDIQAIRSSLNLEGYDFAISRTANIPKIQTLHPKTLNELIPIVGAPNTDPKEIEKYVIDVLVQLSDSSLRDIALRLLNSNISMEFLPGILQPAAENILREDQNLTVNASKCRELLIDMRPEFAVMKQQVQSLPFPISTIANRLLTTYENFVENPKSSDDEVIAVIIRIHQLFSSWPRFAAATSLSILWMHLPNVSSPIAAKTQYEIVNFGSSDNRDWQQTSSTLSYLRQLCLEGVERLDGPSNSQNPGTLRNLIDDKGFVFAGFRPCETDAAYWTQILEMELAKHVLKFVDFVHDAWAGYEVVIPTKILPDGSSVKEILRCDKGTESWSRQQVSLLLKSSDAGHTRIDPWDGVILENQSPLVIRSNLLVENDAESIPVALTHANGFSLFPFASVDPTSVNGGSVPTFLLFDGLQFDDSEISRIEYMPMTGNSEARRFIGRPQSPTHLDSMSSFLMGLRRINPSLKLDVEPESVDPAHDYVLCSEIVGRDDELAEMTKWLCDPTAPSVFCWRAWGGDGKSAMAYEWLFNKQKTTDALKELGYQGAVWATFYQPDFDIHAFCNKALEKMHVNIGKVRNSHETIQLFLEEAERRKFLFVLDGFERLLESESELDVDAHRMIQEFGDLPREYRMCRNRDSKFQGQAQGDIFLEGICKLPLEQCRFLITSRFCPTTVELYEEQDKAIVKTLAALTNEQAEKIWWASTGREAYNQPYDISEHALVKRAIQNLGRHPLVIGIVASTVWDRHFVDFRAGLMSKNNLDHAPFDDEFKTESGESDYRTRCSEALWYCGSELDPLAKEILVSLQSRAGTSSMEDLLSDDYLLEELGQFNRRKILGNKLEELKKRKWIGISQRGRIDIHPMVRQFAKKERDNRGYTKHHRLGPQEFSDKIRQIKEMVRSSHHEQSGPDLAWNEINRLELWESARRLTTATSSISGSQLFCDLLRRFFSDELDYSKGYLELPKLSQRFSQFQVLYHIGSMESSMGHYEVAKGTLQWAMELAKWMGEASWTELCRSNLQWLHMYQGNLKEAEDLYSNSSYSPLYEVLLSLRGAESTVFAATQPSAYAFQEWKDRRWLFQSLAEAEFWRGRLDKGKQWLVMMEEAVRRASEDAMNNNEESKPPYRGQVMWEYWTRGVFEVETMIREDDFPSDKCDYAFECLNQAGREASEYCYPVVEALSLAFEVRLLSYLAKLDKKYGTKANRTITKFQNKIELKFPIAVSILKLAKVKLNFALEQVPVEECQRLLGEFWEAALPTDNHPFYLSLVLFDQLLNEIPEVEFKFRDKLASKIKEISGADLVQSASKDETDITRIFLIIRQLHGNDSTETVSESGAVSEEIPADVAEWNELKETWGDEIAAFRPLVENFNGDARDFEGGLNTFTLKNDGKVDPLGGLIEMRVAYLEERDARIAASIESLTPYLDDLQNGISDWSNKYFGKLDFSKIERVASSSSIHRDLLIDKLLLDDIRRLKIEESSLDIFKEWCQLVVFNPIEEDDPTKKRLLLAFFEVLIRYQVDLQRLITSMRLPGRFCYIASYLRVATNRFLQQMLEEFGEENKYMREQVELTQMQYRCGWKDTPVHVKSWWQQVTANNYRSSLSLLRQLDQFESTLEKLFLAVEETGSENLQGNLYFLKYKRREALRRGLNQKVGSLSLWDD